MKFPSLAGFVQQNFQRMAASVGASSTPHTVLMDEMGILQTTHVRNFAVADPDWESSVPQPPVTVWTPTAYGAGLVLMSVNPSAHIV